MWPQVPCKRWFCLTALDASCLHEACPTPRFLRVECCRWRDWYRNKKLGDRKAKISPTKWHSEPYGFEIIGSDRTETEGGGALFSYTDALRTVHLTGSESVTVSSCLADNMAKGIHLNRRTERRLVREVQRKGHSSSPHRLPFAHAKLMQPLEIFFLGKEPLGGWPPLHAKSSILSELSNQSRKTVKGSWVSQQWNYCCIRQQGLGDGMGEWGDSEIFPFSPDRPT